MKRATLLLIVLLNVFPATGQAYSNTEEFFNSSQNQPAWFEVSADGSAYGETVAGEVFTQINVRNNLGLRIQKFAIGSAYFYITDKGIIRAYNDLSAVSIYFTLA